MPAPLDEYGNPDGGNVVGTDGLTRNRYGEVVGAGQSGTGPTIQAAEPMKAELAESSAGIDDAGCFLGAELTGTGAPQTQAHGLGTIPSIAWATITAGTDGAGGAGDKVPTVSSVTRDATNLTVTVTAGAKVRLYAVR